MTIEPPILTLSNAITIRAWHTTDIDSLTQHANNPNIAQNVTDRFPHPYTRDDAQTWISHCTDKSSWLSTDTPTSNAPEVVNLDKLIARDYAICHDNVAIGGVGIEHSQTSPRSVMLGYWLAEPFWRRGIATEVATAFVQWVFDTFPWVVRIDADAYSWNMGSQRVLNKAGFQEEGRQRWKAVKILNGQEMWGDLVLFGRIREGFMARGIGIELGRE